MDDLTVAADTNPDKKDLSTSPQLAYLYTPGTLPYAQAWQWQQRQVAQRKDNPALPDGLLLLEHLPVYTLGHGSTTDFLKFDPMNSAVDLYRTERGGEVTYHCPGQLVGYPILNLRRHHQDLHWYLRQLEGVLIDVLATLGLAADRIEGLTGVWVDGCKVAAIGIKVSRWITFHGFALNVCPDLSGFERIVPCGIEDRAVGSLAQFRAGLTVADVQPVVAQIFAERFQLHWQPQISPELDIA